LQAVNAIGNCRRAITSGFSGRKFSASSSTNAQSLFDRLGGIEVVSKIVHRMYDNITADPRIGVYFSGAKMKTVRQSQTAYLSEALGATDIK
jgi:truncated hemoglobin YjbI